MEMGNALGAAPEELAFHVLLANIKCCFIPAVDLFQ